MPTYVEYGVADCGVAGKDVLLETGADVLEPLDLGFGRCRVVVASPAGTRLRARPAATTRVASKYAKLAAAHFLERGLGVEVVRLAGSVEIAPGLGLADCIVDVVETGRTLAENGLAEVETVALSSARLDREPGELPRAARRGAGPRGEAAAGLAMRVIAGSGAAYRRWLAAPPRASAPRAAVMRVVERIVRDVRDNGDAALVRLGERSTA